MIHDAGLIGLASRHAIFAELCTKEAFLDDTSRDFVVLVYTSHNIKMCRILMWCGPIAKLREYVGLSTKFVGPLGVCRGKACRFAHKSVT